MKRQNPKAYLEPSCIAIEIKSIQVICTSVTTDGVTVNPFSGNTEEEW